MAEGIRYALATIPNEEGDPEEIIFRAIDRLKREREKNVDSVYAPWALCRIGALYLQAVWWEEANGIFDQFLDTYPNSPLEGDVILGAGLSFLHNQKYLEAALIFRKVVEEPRWTQHHLDGALGLADATALSHAWNQAYYWYPGS